MFNEDELEEARQRADFVIEVDTAMRDRKYRNQDECFMGIVGREWRTMQSGCKGSKYPLLVAVWCADGRGTDGWNAARKAFFRWRKTLAEWSTRENPRHNYHVLAPHHRFSMPNQGAPEFWSIAGRIKAQNLPMSISLLYKAATAEALLAGVPKEHIPDERHFRACYGCAYEKRGDSRFWDLLRAGYEHPNAPELTEAYADAVSAAGKLGVLPMNIPPLGAVQYYYTQRADSNAVAAARDPKLINEKFAYSAACTSLNVFPNSCWTLDGRIMDVWVKEFKPDAGPLDPETSRRPGGWIAFRPVMTHLIDSASFFQVALALCRKPNRDTCEFVLRSGIEFRGGAPVAAHTDNGKDFRGALFSRVKLPMDEDALQKVSDALGMRVIFAIHKNPQAKLVELYHRFMLRFERKLLGYHGHNKRQQDNLWHRPGPDGKTLAQRLDHYPDDHPVWPGCLKDPDHCGLLTLDQFRQMWITWRDEKFNAHPMKGPNMRGLSPADKYLRAAERQQDALRPLTPDQISMAFLREYKVALVARGGRVFWTCDGLPKPVAYVAFDAEDRSMLAPWIGKEVLLKVDPTYDPPRMFVFERQEITRGGEALKTWRLIPCNGPMGSVPNENETEKYNAGKPQLRELGRRKRSYERDMRRGHNAAAERELLLSQMEDLGVKTGGAGVDHNKGTYTLQPRQQQAVPQTERKRRMTEAQNALGALVTAEDLAAYDGMAKKD